MSHVFDETDLYGPRGELESEARFFETETDLTKCALYSVKECAGDSITFNLSRRRADINWTKMLL